MTIDSGIEKPGIAEERTTQEMMCNFICGLWVGKKTTKDLEHENSLRIYIFGLLSAVAIYVGIPESISPRKLEYE